ncbi:MAG: endospore germination permease [Peptococcaceae bacterium]|nr:endospore germination permease [Peptococcaceae bacterium]
MQSEKITNTQVILLIIALRFTIYFLSLSTTTPPANQDIWIAQLGSMLYAAILFSPLLILSRKFPNRSLWEYPEQITGKIASKLISVLYLGYLLLLPLLLSINLTLFIGSALLPETPKYIHLIFLFIPSVFAAYQGIVNIARTGQIIIPVVLALFLLTMVLGIPIYDFKVLVPIFKDSTLLQLHQGSLSFALYFQDGLILFFMAPDMKEKFIEKTFFIALVMSTLLFVIISLCPLMVFGVEQVKHLNYPFYLFVREIEVFDFIEHIEPVVLLGWLMDSLFKFSVYTYFAAKGMQQITGAKSHHKFIIPFALCIFGLFFIPALNSIDMVTFISTKIILKVSFAVLFVIPALLAAIYFIKQLLSEQTSR